LPLARAAGHFYRAAKIRYTKQTEFSAIEKRTVGKYECYVKPGKMYAREHIYGIDWDAVVALSSLYETADSLIELARQRVFRNNKTRNCHVLCTDLYKCFLKLFTRIFCFVVVLVMKKKKDMLQL